MTLKELFSHFNDKTTKVDLSTSQFRVIRPINDLESTLSEDLLDAPVSNWFTDNTILMVDI